MTYQVWIEGYSMTGQRATAEFLGVFEADSFQEACIKVIEKMGWDMGSYNPERNSHWGQKFYDNEDDARKYFG